MMVLVRTALGFVGSVLVSVLFVRLKVDKTKKGITFVIPFDALQDGLEPTTP